MGHIYTYDEIKQEFNNRDYILITDRKLKCKEKYEYICKKHKDKGSQFIDWGHFYYSKRGCYYCGRERTEAARRKDLSAYDGKSLAESKGFEYVGMSRHDKKIWVQFICPKHRQYGVQEMPYNNMRRVVVGCQHCIGRNDYEEEVLQEMYNANPNVELLEPYKGRHQRHLTRCIVHDIKSMKTPYEVIVGKGCIECGKEKLAIAAATPEYAFVEELKVTYDYIKLKSGYTSKSEYADFYCEICKAEWTDIPSYVTRRGCPNCSNNSTESKIGYILKELGVQYIPQYSFSDCKDQKVLPFDYYLPQYNVLIEYDGEQHYMPVNFGGISDERAERNLKMTQFHDCIKNDYCENNNIPLMRIPYWEKDNLEHIITININNMRKK